MVDIPVNESTAETLATITANGQELVGFTFLAFSADQIKATYRPISGAPEVPLVEGVNFTVSGLNQPNGGQINLVGIATVVGDQVYIYRDTPIEREKDWQNEGDYKADLVNREQDEIYMIMQELDRNNGKSEGRIQELEEGLAQEIIDRTAEDERIEGQSKERDLALADLIGNIGSGGAPLFDTVTSVSLANIAPPVNILHVSGYHAAGDGGAALYKRAASEPSHAGKVQSNDGAWWELAEPKPNVRQFGAKGDGVTNDTAAITAADAYCRLLKARLFFPYGIYMVSQLVINIDTDWQGEGKKTTIKQIVGSNTTLLYGVNTLENTGKPATEAVGFPYNFSIQDITIDGSWNSGAGNTTGSGYWVYGDRCEIRNLFIKNVAETGFAKEFIGDSPANYDSRFLESTFEGIRVDYVGGHGFIDAGPHDSVHRDIIVLDCGQKAANTYDGFYYGTGSSARNVAIHAASRSGRLRMRHAVNLNDGAYQEFTGGCQIEGAGVANLRVASRGCLFDSTTRIYAPFGGVNILLEGNCSLNDIRGELGSPPGGLGLPDAIGVKFGTAATDNINDNNFELMGHDQNGGFVVFSARDLGRNTFNLRYYQTANTLLVGTKHPATYVIGKGAVNGGVTHSVDTLNQTAYLTIPAGQSYLWTFPYPFRTNPNVQATYGIPSVGPDKPVWVSTVSPTNANIFNPTTSPQGVFVKAEGVL